MCPGREGNAVVRVLICAGYELDAVELVEKTLVRLVLEYAVT